MKDGLQYKSAAQRKLMPQGHVAQKKFRTPMPTKTYNALNKSVILHVPAKFSIYLRWQKI